MPVYKAPAKINLGLHVGSLREDGYHNIETFMQTISLFDLITIESAKKFRFSFEDFDFPADEENLCVKAFRLFSEYTGIDRPVSIDLKKRIPVGAGLGGGSSDAASIIRALNDIWECRLNNNELSSLGAKIGSDVPFFLKAVSGAAICTGRGEIVKPYNPIFTGYVIVVYTGKKISTKWAYKNIDKNLTNFKKNVILKRYILQHFPAKKGLNGLKNDFSKIVFGQFRELEKIVTALNERGAVYSSLSGSGSAVFGLFSDKISAARAFDALPEFAFKAIADTPAPFNTI